MCRRRSWTMRGLGCHNERRGKPQSGLEPGDQAGTLVPPSPLALSSHIRLQSPRSARPVPARVWPSAPHSAQFGNTVYPSSVSGACFAHALPFLSWRAVNFSSSSMAGQRLELLQTTDDGRAVLSIRRRNRLRKLLKKRPYLAFNDRHYCAEAFLLPNPGSPMPAKNLSIRS